MTIQEECIQNEFAKLGISTINMEYMGQPLNEFSKDDLIKILALEFVEKNKIEKDYFAHQKKSFSDLVSVAIGRPIIR